MNRVPGNAQAGKEERKRNVGDPSAAGARRPQMGVALGLGFDDGPLQTPALTRNPRLVPTPTPIRPFPTRPTTLIRGQREGAIEMMKVLLIRALKKRAPASVLSRGHARQPYDSALLRYGEGRRARLGRPSQSARAYFHCPYRCP
jgi:hypothetical protein